MSIAKSFSAQLIGLSSEIVTVEVDISNGLHAFTIVGLGDRSVGEAKDRISAAIKNSGYKSPKQKNHKVVISLAPADIHKEGATFDLAMAIAYLTATEDISALRPKTLILGELSLEGDIRRVHGVLPILSHARTVGFEAAIIPESNAREASLARGIRVYTASTLREVIRHASGDIELPLVPEYTPDTHKRRTIADISLVRGNDTAKRGLLIAAAGAHNIALYGPPGTGKTMLAQCFPGILPALSYDQAVEVTGIHSAARTLSQGLISDPPFRAPHHTASYPAIIGGGAIPRPGEITLAHRGVLFLDEFPEFDRDVIEALRQPLEDRTITVSRAKGTVTFPAQCILVASMNPCPCGKGRSGGCLCPKAQIDAYKRKISGPITDRIDVWCSVHKVDYQRLASQNRDELTSETMLERITAARNIQRQRLSSFGSTKLFNAEMTTADINKLDINPEARSLLATTAEKLGISGRGFHKTIKVARTIADLADSIRIEREHILEAFQYRQRSDEI